LHTGLFMSWKKTFAALLPVVLTIAGIAQAASIQPEAEPAEAGIIHIPVTSLRQNERLAIEARVDGATQPVVFMRLYYKSPGLDSFDYVEMSKAADGYFGELSPDRFPGGRVSYFILALFADQSVVTFPQSNPYGNPIEVEISGGGAAVPSTKPVVRPGFNQTEPAGLPEPESGVIETAPAVLADSPVLVLSPEPDEKFGVGEEVVIAISLFADEGDSVDVGSLDLFVDGQRRSLDAEITADLVTYTTSNLRPGRHTATLRGYFASGVALPRAQVRFVVKGKARSALAERPVQARVFAETRHENTSGIGFNDNNIGGSLSGNHGLIKYDAKFYLTSRENSQFQPRNRYSFNLELPLLGVSVGDVYPRFNDLMLWGKRVRGLYGRLHLGVINFDFITGQTLRKVPALYSTVIDTLTNLPLKNIAGNDSTAVSTTGTWNQNLIGGRVSFGGGRNFQLGFNLLKVKDDSTALAASEFSTTPQDNLVLGSDFLLAFANHRIEFRAGAAYSLITEDILGGPLTKAEIDTLFPDFDLPIDPADFSDYLIINLSTKPLEDPRKGRSLAVNSSFRFNFLNNNLVVGYKRLGGEYVSLGNSFLRNNLRGFFFQDRFRLFRNKLYLNFGLENYDDNFDAVDENTPTKLKTVSSGFTVYPGAQWPSFTFSLRNHNRDNNIDSLFIDLSQITPDTTHVGENNDTRDVSFQMNYDTRFLNLNHSISLSYITSDRNDKFVPETENASNVEVVTVRTRYDSPLVTTLNFARNDNNFGNGLNTFNFKMLGLKAEYPFFSRKLKTYLGANFTSASGVSASDTTTTTSVTDYKRLAFNVGARFDIASGQFFSLDASLVSFNDNGFTLDTTTGLNVPNPSFTDRVFRLYYEKRF